MNIITFIEDRLKYLDFNIYTKTWKKRINIYNIIENTDNLPLYLEKTLQDCEDQYPGNIYLEFTIQVKTVRHYNQCYMNFTEFSSYKNTILLYMVIPNNLNDQIPLLKETNLNSLITWSKRLCKCGSSTEKMIVKNIEYFNYLSENEYVLK